MRIHIQKPSRLAKNWVCVSPVLGDQRQKDHWNVLVSKPTWEMAVFRCN